MTREERKEQNRQQWLDENCSKALLVSNRLIPLRPNMGYFVSVNGIDIGEDIFKDEYEAITEAYHSVMEKMEAHYKVIRKPNKIQSNMFNIY
jgi:hypothetical protein